MIQKITAKSRAHLAGTFSGFRRGMSYLFCISDDWLIALIEDWLTVHMVGVLDMAITNRAERMLWFRSLRVSKAKAFSHFQFNHSSIRWLIKRGLSTSSIHIMPTKEKEITDSTFDGICIPSLQYIDLSTCDNLTDSGMTAVAIGCHNLQSIKLELCRNLFSNGSLDGLSFHFRELKNLDLNCCANVTDECLVDLATGCPHLGSINLTNGQYITDDGLAELVKGCHEINEIVLSNCYRITNDGLISLANNLPKLQLIDLTRCRDITDIGIATLAKKCSELIHIDLNRCRNVTNIGLEFISLGCHKLEYINVNRLRRISDEGLNILVSGCHQLRKLVLDDCGVHVTESGIAEIRRNYPHLIISKI